MANDPTKPYSVNEWGSHPDEENDDCWTGEDFATREEAEAAFAAGSEDLDTCYLELDGPDVYKVRKLRNPRPYDDSEWRREIAREEGMLNGMESYNDWMGY
jgi:hypothetical protein